jgi:AraC-like DNA-binding protein
VDVAVLDPAADGIVRTSEIRTLIDQYPTLPVVLYTALSPLTLKALVELSKHGAQQVVLHRFDDSPRTLRNLLEGQPGTTFSALLLERMAVPIGALPGNLARAIERMFKRPGQFFGVPDLVSAAQMPTRTVYRQLERVGLASPRIMVAAARLLRAYSYMREPGHTMLDVERKLGFAPGQLRRAMIEMVGETPGRIRATVTPEQFVDLIVKQLYPGVSTPVRITRMPAALDPPAAAPWP